MLGASGHFRQWYDLSVFVVTSLFNWPFLHPRWAQVTGPILGRQVDAANWRPMAGCVRTCWTSDSPPPVMLVGMEGDETPGPTNRGPFPSRCSSAKSLIAHSRYPEVSTRQPLRRIRLSSGSSSFLHSGF